MRLRSRSAHERMAPRVIQSWIAQRLVLCLLLAAAALSVPADLPAVVLATLTGSRARLEAARQVAAVFYVAPTGDDGQAGSEAAPFRTLERARTAARALTAGMTGDIVVYLRGGVYPLTATVTFECRGFGPNQRAVHAVRRGAAAFEVPEDVPGGVEPPKSVILGHWRWIEIVGTCPRADPGSD